MFLKPGKRKGGSLFAFLPSELPTLSLYPPPSIPPSKWRNRRGRGRVNEMNKRRSVDAALAAFHVNSSAGSEVTLTTFIPSSTLVLLHEVSRGGEPRGWAQTSAFSSLSRTLPPNPLILRDISDPFTCFCSIKTKWTTLHSLWGVGQTDREREPEKQQEEEVIGPSLR